jgi:FtsH-binding integral membrane protein
MSPTTYPFRAVFILGRPSFLYLEKTDRASGRDIYATPCSLAEEMMKRINRQGAGRSRISPFARRCEQLLDAAARRSRDTMRDRIAGLRAAALPITQSAIAAGVSWWAAAKVVGHREAFFAPIAAVISLGVSQSQRLVRAIELVLGVAMGLFVADLLVFWIGTGALQITVVVALAMVAAVVLQREALVSQSGRDLSRLGGDAYAVLGP